MTYRAIVRKTCPDCKGEGYKCKVGALGLHQYPCPTCKGTGKVKEELEILKITTKEKGKETRII